MEHHVDFFYYISISLFGILAFLYFIFTLKNTQNRWKKQALIEKIKQIVYISLFSALSTSVVLMISVFFSFTVIPEVRVSFQGILVKLSGFIFGPITGIITAIVTELCVIIFAPVYFHYKYLISLIAFGFLAGLVKKLRSINESPIIKLMIIFFGLIIFTYFSFIFFSATGEQVKLIFNFQEIFSGIKNRFFVNISLKNIFKTIIFVLSMLSLISVFFACFIFFIKFWFTKKRKDSQKTENLKILISILMLAIYSEYFVSLSISTSANLDVFGGNPDTTGFILLNYAFLIAPIKILINTSIIYTIWIIISPFIRKKFIIF